MNPVFRKLQVSVTQLALSQALPLCRATPSIQHPVWCTAANERQYRGRPTQGIGRWRYLVILSTAKKKKRQLRMVPIKAATDTAYGTLNVKVSGHDMTVVERYSQYVHHLCNRLDVVVGDSYGLPTKTTEVMLMQEKGTKMYADAYLKTHSRVIQVRSLNTTLCPIFINVLLHNQPEGVQLSLTEHTKNDFDARFKGRPGLQELMAQLNLPQV